jgi:hypothetical protein
MEMGIYFSKNLQERTKKCPSFVGLIPTDRQKDRAKLCRFLCVYFAFIA